MKTTDTYSQVIQKTTGMVRDRAVQRPATREGTSITVIDNVRDGCDAGRTWGQRLFFNQNGERASPTGQRKSDFLAERQGQQKTEETAENQSDRAGLNMVLLIQVPLKQKEPITHRILAEFDDVDTGVVYCCYAPSDVEEAVIGHGKVEGPFTEIDGLEIERGLQAGHDRHRRPDQQGLPAGRLCGQPGCGRPHRSTYAVRRTARRAAGLVAHVLAAAL